MVFKRFFKNSQLGNASDWDMYCIGLGITNNYHKFDTEEEIIPNQYEIITATIRNRDPYFPSVTMSNIFVERTTAILLDPIYYAQNMFSNRFSVFVIKQTKSDAAEKLAEETFNILGGKNGT